MNCEVRIHKCWAEMEEKPVLEIVCVHCGAPYCATVKGKIEKVV